jgi:hypothetical protein
VSGARADPDAPIRPCRPGAAEYCPGIGPVAGAAGGGLSLARTHRRQVRRQIRRDPAACVGGQPAGLTGDDLCHPLGHLTCAQQLRHRRHLGEPILGERELAGCSGRRHPPGEPELFGDATTSPRQRHLRCSLGRELRPGEIHRLPRLRGGDGTTQSLQRRDAIHALGVVCGTRQLAEPCENTIQLIDDSWPRRGTQFDHVFESRRLLRQF